MCMKLDLKLNETERSMKSSFRASALAVAILGTLATAHAQYSNPPHVDADDDAQRELRHRHPETGRRGPGHEDGRRRVSRPHARAAGNLTIRRNRGACSTARNTAVASAGTTRTRTDPTPRPYLEPDPHHLRFRRQPVDRIHQRRTGAQMLPGHRQVRCECQQHHDGGPGHQCLLRHLRHGGQFHQVAMGRHDGSQHLRGESVRHHRPVATVLRHLQGLCRRRGGQRNPESRSVLREHD